MNEHEARCFLGTILGLDKGTKHIDDAAVEQALKDDPHALAQYAESSTKANSAVAQAALANPNSMQGKVAQAFEQATGIGAAEPLRFTARMDEVFGEQRVAPVIKLLEDFQAANPLPHSAGISDAQLETMRTAQRSLYNKTVVPQLAKMVDPSGLPLELQGSWVDYINSEIKGVSVFGVGTSKNPFVKAIKNTLGNLVSNNPTIALYNLYEIAPKMQVYAIQNGGAGAQKAVATAMANFAKKSGGKAWARVPEYEAAGIYGNKQATGIAGKVEKAIGVSNLVDTTENPLRGLMYELGEAIEPGSGRRAVEQMAYAYRPGNMPFMLRSKEGELTVHLMRYGIETMKFYGKLWKNAVAGPDLKTKVNSAAALITMHGLLAVQGGVKGSVPLPLWEALPEDVRDDLEALDDEVPFLNLSKKVMGIDASKAMQPLGGIAFGVGGSIMTTNLGTGIRDVVQSPSTALEDPTNGAMQLLQGALEVGQITKIPGVNLTTTRLLKAARKSYERNETAPEEVKANVLDAFNLEPAEE